MQNNEAITSMIIAPIKPPFELLYLRLQMVVTIDANVQKADKITKINGK